MSPFDIIGRWRRDELDDSDDHKLDDSDDHHELDDNDDHELDDENDSDEGELE